MIHELHDEMVHSEFKGGRLTFHTYVSDMIGGEDEAALLAIADEMDALTPDSTEEVGIACHFTAASLADSVIDMYRLYPDHEGDPVRMELADKPMIDVFRAELQAMLARIDAIQWEETKP